MTNWSIVNSIYLFLQRNISAIAEYREKEDEQLITILSTFIAAHKHAQVKIPYYFGETSAIDTVEQAQVVQESQSLVELAVARLSDLQKVDVIEYRQTKEKALHILSRFEASLFEFREDAVITSSDLEHFLEAVTEDRHAIDKLFRAVSSARFNDSQSKTRIPVGHISKILNGEHRKDHPDSSDMMKPLL